MIFLEYLRVFVLGGILCVIAQILLDKTQLTPARILVGYVVAGVILGALGLYRPLIEFGGAGAKTPLSGFGNLIAEGVRKSVERDGAMGILSGPLTAAATGISAALCFGFIASLIFHGKRK